MRAYQFDSFPFISTGQERSLVKFDIPRTLFFGKNRTDARLRFLECTKTDHKEFCMFGTEEKVNNQCLSDLLTTKSSNKCDIEVLDRECSVEKINNMFILSSINILRDQK